MDIIAFKPISLGPTHLESAQIVNNYTSATWIERYREPGEFKIVAPLSSGLRDVLPLDTLVSHVDTLDLMFVESHIIIEEQNVDPVIEISGRSFDAFLEHRVVNMHRDWSVELDGLPNFVISLDYSWEQAKDLINFSINAGSNFQAEELIPNMIADVDISGTFTPAFQWDRAINRGALATRVREILALDDLGLRMVRKNPFGSTPGSSTNTLFIIHNGKDKTANVLFSSKTGDIESAEYLWTNKTLKNAALVTGTWVETRVNTESPIADEYDRRVAYIPADDIDQGYEVAPPVGGERDEVYALLEARGQMILAGRRRFMITRADVSPRARFQYRRDYGIGDIVTVQTNYGDVSPMRVVEFTEIQDSTGESGHPTLGVLDY